MNVALNARYELGDGPRSVRSPIFPPCFIANDTKPMTQRTVLITKQLQYLIAANVVSQLLLPVPAPSVEIKGTNSPICSSIGFLWNDTLLCCIYILGLNHTLNHSSSGTSSSSNIFPSWVRAQHSAILFLVSPCCIATKTGYRKMLPKLTRHAYVGKVMSSQEVMYSRNANGHYMDSSRLTDSAGELVSCDIITM